MTLLAISSSTVATVLIAALLGVFLLLLGASLMRARRSQRALAAAGEGGAAPVPGRPAAAAGAPKRTTVISRRDFLRTSLLGSLGMFTAQFGGASIAFLWPKLSSFGSIITVHEQHETIKDQIQESRQPYYYVVGLFFLINYAGDGDQTGGVYVGLTS